MGCPIGQCCNITSANNDINDINDYSAFSTASSTELA